MFVVAPLLLSTAHAAVTMGTGDGEALVSPAGGTWYATPPAPSHGGGSATDNYCGCDQIQYGTCYPRAIGSHVADPVPHKDQCRADQYFLTRNRDSTTTRATCEDKLDHAGRTAPMTYYGMCYTYSGPPSHTVTAYGALWAGDCEEAETFYSVPDMWGTAGNTHGDLSARADDYDCTNTQIGWCYTMSSHAMTPAVDASWCTAGTQVYVKPRSSSAKIGVTVLAGAGVNTFTHANPHGMVKGDRFKIAATTLPKAGGVDLKVHTGANADDEYYVVEDVKSTTAYTIATGAAPDTPIAIDAGEVGTDVKIFRPAYLCDKVPSTSASSNIVPATFGNCYALSSPALGAHKMFCALSEYYCSVDLDYVPTPSPTAAPTDGFMTENGAWVWTAVGLAGAGILAYGFYSAYKAGKLQGMSSWKMFSSKLDEAPGAEMTGVSPGSKSATRPATKV